MSGNSVPKFEVLHTLQSHRSGVNVVKISPDGSLLLSGTQDGTLTIWDTVNGLAVQTFTLATSHGITAAAWCPSQIGQPVEAFVVGKGVGKVTIYRKSAMNYDYASAVEAFGGPVEDLAYDPKHGRIAAVGSGCLKLFIMDASYTISFLGGTTPRDYTARSTGFYAEGTCVFVCYLESQHMTGYSISPWMVQFDGDLATRIGHAAFADGGDLFVTNLATGMDVYSFPPTPIPKRSVRFHISQNYPLIVAVSPQASFAVVGGEDGHARVYDLRYGVVDGLLPHGNHDSLIQQVDMHVSRKRSIIVTGCADDGDGSVKIWTPLTTRTASPAAIHSTDTWAKPMAITFATLAILLAIVVAHGFLALISETGRAISWAQELIADMRPGGKTASAFWGRKIWDRFVNRM